MSQICGNGIGAPDIISLVEGNVGEEALSFCFCQLSWS